MTQNRLKWSSKVIRFSEIKISSSSDKISNYTCSSTSSKVSVNKNFMKVIRFSIQERPSVFMQVYNKYKFDDPHGIKKRKSKSQVNICNFSENLWEVIHVPKHKRKRRK